MDNENEARAALDALGSSQRKLAASYDYPFIRHLAFAGLLGVLIAGQALPPSQSTVVTALMVVGTLLVVRWDRARTGAFLNGWRPGRTRWATAGVVVIALAMMLAAMRYGGPERPLVPVLLGLAFLPVGVAFSYLWQRIYLADLRRDGGA